jgi:NAD(P)-dependent dehydrogenase (short-subunit alcohol dehydrogenase family)
VKVWFITGTSRGFGRVWAEAAAARGDAVVATAIRLDDIKDLAEQYPDTVLPLELDVRDRAAAGTALARGAERFGRLDVVVNNAGYGRLGMVEELTEAEARDQLETNFFGALWVTQAALPILRDGGGGRILQVSSMGGLAAYPYFGLYNASKWALEGMSQALAGEVAPFGVKVTIVEPVGYATDWWGSSLRRTEPLGVYDETRARIEANWGAAAAGRGDPKASAAAVLALADADDPPLRLLLGVGGLERMEAEYASRLDVWRSWNNLSVSAHTGPQEDQ